MRRDLGGAYVLDDDPARIDRDVVFGYISGESYWGKGRSRGMIDGCIAGAFRVIGLYHGDRQVGFARVVSDGLTVAYLCDVFVLAEHRGQGRGVALVREAVDGADLAKVKWMLHTEDAHGLYEKLGFARLGSTTMERLPAASA